MLQFEEDQLSSLASSNQPIVDDHDHSNTIIESQAEAIQKAKSIYESGSYALPAAKLTLFEPLPISVTKGKNVIGMSTKLNEVIGYIEQDTKAGSNTLLIRYKVSTIPKLRQGTKGLGTNAEDDDGDDSSCVVGGHFQPIINGCFVNNGIIMIEGNGGDGDGTTDTTTSTNVVALHYLYDPYVDNVNLISLQGFSLNAQRDLFDCTLLQSLTRCPYNIYEKYVFYYGEFDYASHIINDSFLSSTAASTRTTSTSFRRGNFNINYNSSFQTRIGM